MSVGAKTIVRKTGKKNDKHDPICKFKDLAGLIRVITLMFSIHYVAVMRTMRFDCIQFDTLKHTHAHLRLQFDQCLTSGVFQRQCSIQNID
jgi:hypothetical protein